MEARPICTSLRVNISTSFIRNSVQDLCCGTLCKCRHSPHICLRSVPAAALTPTVGVRSTDRAGIALLPKRPSSNPLPLPSLLQAWPTLATRGDTGCFRAAAAAAPLLSALTRPRGLMARRPWLGAAADGRQTSLRRAAGPSLAAAGAWCVLPSCTTHCPSVAQRSTGQKHLGFRV